MVESCWLIGEGKQKGKAVIVVARYGEDRAVLL
jgi:hypothetical protein